MAIRKIQFRRGPAEEWTSVNPILAMGEPGFEEDTLKLKIGDGTTRWNDLRYTVDTNIVTSDTPPTGLNINDIWINTAPPA